MTWVDFQTKTSESNRPVETEIRDLWREYLVDILGIPSSVAQARIEAEVAGQLHVGLLDGLEARGWVFRDAVVLDLGCGTGALASALTDRGALVVGVEPSPAWAMVAHKRLRQKGSLQRGVIIADGARIPLADNSIDYVMSLQVLEHVSMQAAKHIIAEIARVLRPGGRVYLAFENYWSFWEPHYRVRWLPLLPKRAGAFYLKLRGRNPQFLREHIYYNSFVTLAQTCFNVGLTRPHWDTLAQKLEKPELVKGPFRRQLARVFRFLPPDVRSIIVVLVAERSQLMRTTVQLELKHG